MKDVLKIGIIGFDTSHVPAFIKILNDPTDKHHVPGGKVVAGFPSSSPDLELSASRVDGFKKEAVEKWKIPMTGSIEELIEQVDAVLLESVDGRRHLAEAKPVIAAKKPVFIDKPLAANYRDAAAIINLAEKHRCPIFSSSSLRYDANMAALRQDKEMGRIVACDAFGPSKREQAMPGLFWYGIHGIEILYSFMGTGCLSVTSTHTETCEVVTGVWKDRRIGTFRGILQGAGSYGATVFGENKVHQATYNTEIPFYALLMKEIIAFFKTGIPPVPNAETLEIMAFIQAALVSENEKRTVYLDEISKS